MEDDTVELETVSFIWTIENLTIFMLDNSLEPMSRSISLEKAPYYFTLELYRDSNSLAFDVLWNGDGPSNLEEMPCWIEMWIEANYELIPLQPKRKPNLLVSTKLRKNETFKLSIEYISDEMRNFKVSKKHTIFFNIYVLLPRIPHNGDIDKNLELLSSDLSALYERGRESEGGISCKSSNGSLLLIHSAILAGRCPYFKENPKEFLRTMEKFPTVVLDKLFRYIYSGYFEFKKSDYKHLIKFRNAIIRLKLPALNILFQTRKMIILTKIPTTNIGCVTSFENIYSGAEMKVCTIEHADWEFEIRLKRDIPTVFGGKCFSIEVKILNMGRLQQEETFLYLKASNKSIYSSDSIYREGNGYVSIGNVILFRNFINVSPDKLRELELSTLGSTLILDVDISIRLQSSPTKHYILKEYSVQPNVINSGRNLGLLSQNLLSFELTNIEPGDYNFYWPEGSRKLSYKFHNAILAARWPYLANCANFNLKLLDKRSSNKAIWKALRFVYSGKIEIDQCDELEIFEICCLADKYDYPALRELCYSAFKNIMNLDNVCTILRLSVLLDSDYLMSMSMMFIKENFTELAQSVFWKELEDHERLLSEIAMTFARGETLLPFTNEQFFIGFY